MWEGEKFHSKIRVLCNGPKTTQYLDLIEELREKGMSILPIIESLDELDRISKYKGDIGVRVDLNIKADTHWDKKFDRFGLSERDVLELSKLWSNQQKCSSRFARSSATKGNANLNKSIDEFSLLPVPSRMARATAVVAYAPSTCTR